MLLVLAGPAGPCQDMSLSPSGADTPTSSRAQCVAAMARVTLGRWHLGLTFLLEVPVLSVPAPCSKETKGARAAQPATAPASSQLEAQAGVMPAHQTPLVLPGQPKHSQGDRAKQREGEQDAPGSALAFATNPMGRETCGRPCPEHPPRGANGAGAQTSWDRGDKRARDTVGTHCPASPCA